MDVYRQNGYVRSKVVSTPSIIMEVFAEIACAEASIHVVNEFALKKKLNQLQLASMIPGLVHNHTPTSEDTSDCMYCKRAGNIFNEDQNTEETNDIIGKYRKQIVAFLEEMEKELNSELSKCVNKIN
ncbi:hypothetical protein ATCVMN08101_809R [Acanthocystis turfacea Chlorella virus MN0810.1]|nr:hypothetical protein ATCVMN08101_809R [Acanthocystis turfacea Chlorella virus MN0810.1]